MSEILKTVDDVLKRMEEIRNIKEPNKRTQPNALKGLLAKTKLGKK